MIRSCSIAERFRLGMVGARTHQGIHHYNDSDILLAAIRIQQTTPALELLIHLILSPMHFGPVQESQRRLLLIL